MGQTVPQQTITDILNKEGKLPKTIAKKAECLQSATFKIMNGKLGGKDTGRIKVLKQQDDCSLQE